MPSTIMGIFTTQYTQRSELRNKKEPSRGSFTIALYPLGNWGETSQYESNDNLC